MESEHLGSIGAKRAPMPERRAVTHKGAIIKRVARCHLLADHNDVEWKQGLGATDLKAHVVCYCNRQPGVKHMMMKTPVCEVVGRALPELLKTPGRRISFQIMKPENLRKVS